MEIGAHYSIEDILENRPITQYVQFCTGSPLTTKRILTDGVIQQIKTKLNGEYNVVHASYILNICNQEYNQWTVEYLVKEIHLCEDLGVHYLIVHGGTLANKKQTIDYKQAIDNVNYIIEEVYRITDSQVKICIETMPGKGKQIFTEPIHFKDLFNTMSSNIINKVCICFDTCHVFDASEGVSLYTLWTLRWRVLKDKVEVIHLNGSSFSNGKNKDRHKNLEGSSISIDHLAYIVKDHVGPIILETPSDRYEQDIEYLLINCEE